MSKKRKNRKAKGHKPAAKPHGEERRAEAATVAWMLATLATLAAEVAALLLMWLIGNNQPPGETNVVAAIPPMLFFTASITGLVALCLTPLVYVFRRVKPPLLISIIAVVIAVSPWLALILMARRMQP